MKHQKIVIETDVKIKMRDGVKLSADIYRPAAEGKYPVLLTRLPYGKTYGLHFLRPQAFAENGYVVVVQDVRGRYGSEGEFVPYIAEVDDGYDTIEWLAVQDFSNGNVGMFGLSYYGFTQVLAAISGAPHLKTIAPIMAQNSMKDVFNDHDGALELGMWETWNLESILPDMMVRKYAGTPEYADKMNELVKDLSNIEKWYDYKPYLDWPPMKKADAMPYYTELLQLERDHKHWETIDASKNYEKIKVPGMHVAGWYDCFLDKTIANFQNGHRKGLGDRLIIGPWTHGNFVQMIGQRDFGMAANKWGEASRHDFHLEWFDYWLKGIEPKTAAAPIEYFVMGSNEWKEAKNWPLENTHFTPLYFHSEGEANSKSGNGTASFAKPKAEVPDSYTYDPENPVPSCGGGTLHKEQQPDGPHDQSVLEDREDILCYTTAPLREALEVTGPVQVQLWAKTDAVSTDFTAKLVDVAPDGTAYNLADGIIRSTKQHTNVQGELLLYTIDLWSTSNKFLVGHQIRVEISSSNFPRFDPNPNTGKTFIDTVESVPAQQQIYHDADHPSHILLPIIK